LEGRIIFEHQVKNPKKLLVVHQGALGDVVATFPALIHLKKHFQQIDALCQNQLGEMARILGVVAKSYPLEAAAFATLYANPAGPCDSRVQTFLKTYHEIVLFSFSERLELTVRKLTATKVHRISPRAREDQRIHVTEHIFCNLVRCGLLEIGASTRHSFLSAIEHQDRRDRRFDPASIFIHPGAGSRRKFWPLSHFLTTATHLRSEGFRPSFILGPAEYSLADSLSANDAHNSRIHMLADLRELVSLLKSGGGYIGNDSGVSHLAAFLGLPTVAVFGPSDPARWRPIGRVVQVLRSECDCSPCFETTRQNCDEADCFDGISPNKVTEALIRIL
jgi:ADP-heptose:LPS heptosyltransferase